MGHCTLEALRDSFAQTLNHCQSRYLLGFSEIGPHPAGDGQGMARCVSLALAMNDSLMDSISDGPHAAYYAEYERVNALLDELAAGIARIITGNGGRALAIASSRRTDEAAIAGDFPHKTGAVLAGMGWIGRNCQLVTPEFGPRVRLVSVLTDMQIGRQTPPVTSSRCGNCGRCVASCPAKALTGEKWQAGMARAAMLDARACDDYKKEYYAQFDGMVCGICASVCPWGRKKRSGEQGVEKIARQQEAM